MFNYNTIENEKNIINRSMLILNSIKHNSKIADNNDR